ncbi:YbaB/EbfC family nucleoid-associated protein [Saccharothrix australiensis]|uniref:YbaB/EbfC DNA-binding family protein n=1 Tax=Saccharothrix australiensis TaxID=2072 RepID=A0A495VWU1_9PSEU|nr:YbaB/EbfC family nucleoid-associated protein [Saccharothrix australiensis]RKT53053.1 YbaB/EbfC DNA-binding family protein [Saccharothrix australiensis]
MTDPVFGGDEIRTEQEIARWAAGVAAKAEKYQAVSRQVADVTVDEASGDGLVRLSVTASGALASLEISDKSREVSGAALAATIMATMRRAQSRLAGRVSEIVAAVGVDEPGTAEALVSSYRRRFPEPAPDAPPWADQVRPSAPPPARRPVQDDDDWDGPAVTE